jgi:glycosyltransferase involved in cell wall biosynthesis
VQAVWNRAAAQALRETLAALPRGGTAVHIHSWSKALSPSVFAAAGASGHPVYATLHDYGFVCPNAALHDFPLGRACTLKPMSLACMGRNCDSRKYVHKLWRLGRQFSLEHLAGAAGTLTAAVCVSEYSRQVYAQHLPQGLATTVVENPIDARDLGPATPAANRAFVYAGRLSREKGVLLLAEAARLAGVPLKIVGDGELAAQVRELNPDVAVTGWLPRPEVERELRDARALVLPALWRETQGMVVPEAMAAGLPCVVSSDTAPAAVVQDGRTGRIFANGDREALAAVLRELAGDDQAVAQMGQAAYRQYWSRPPTLDAHLDALENLYGSAPR